MPGRPVSLLFNNTARKAKRKKTTPCLGRFLTVCKLIVWCHSVTNIIFNSCEFYFISFTFPSNQNSRLPLIKSPRFCFCPNLNTASNKIAIHLFKPHTSLCYLTLDNWERCVFWSFFKSIHNPLVFFFCSYHLETKTDNTKKQKSKNTPCTPGLCAV